VCKMMNFESIDGTIFDLRPQWFGQLIDNLLTEFVDNKSPACSTLHATPCMQQVPDRHFTSAFASVGHSMKKLRDL
jgi:hypothetical protein